MFWDKFYVFHNVGTGGDGCPMYCLIIDGDCNPSGDCCSGGGGGGDCGDCGGGLDCGGGDCVIL